MTDSHPKIRPGHAILCELAHEVASSTFGHQEQEVQDDMRHTLEAHIAVRLHDEIPEEHRLTVVGEVVRAFATFCNPLPRMVVRFALLHIKLDRLVDIVASLPREADWVVWSECGDQTCLECITVSTRGFFETCQEVVAEALRSARRSGIFQFLASLTGQEPPTPSLPALVTLDDGVDPNYDPENDPPGDIEGADGQPDVGDEDQ